MPAPAWFFRVPGACAASLPCGARGWRGVPGLTPRRAPSAVRGGAMKDGYVGGLPAIGLLLRTVWSSAIRSRAQGCPSCIPPHAVIVLLPLPSRPVCGRLVYSGPGFTPSVDPRGFPGPVPPCGGPGLGSGSGASRPGSPSRGLRGLWLAKYPGACSRPVAVAGCRLWFRSLVGRGGIDPLP